MAINIVGVSGKNFSSLRKIVLCPKKIFGSQNGTLTEKFLGEGGGGGGVGGRRKFFLSRLPKVAEKGPRHKICLRAPCSSVTLLLARCGCTLRETSQTTYPKVTTTTTYVHNHMFKCRNAQLLVVMLCYNTCSSNFEPNCFLLEFLHCCTVHFTLKWFSM